jgi:ABC-type phosphate transport system substrate-binding protein
VTEFIDHCQRSIFLFILLVSLLFVGDVLPAGNTVETVAHPSVSTEHLSKNLLRSIFSMRLRTWRDGLPIRVFVLPDDAPLHSVFAKQKLNIFPYQLRSVWDRLIFSGTGQAPITVRSEEEMRTRVANTPGAIGYLSGTKIDDSVQIVHVEE